MKVITIAQTGLLAQVRVLGHTLAASNPGTPFCALLIDLAPGEAPPPESFEVVGPEALDLADDDFARMTVMYGAAELAAALKPWALRLVLQQGHDVAVFLDPEVAVYGDLTACADAARAHGIAIAPARLTPMPRDGLRPTEADVMSQGMHALGFVAVTAAADAWLRFWQERLLTDAIVDADQQLYADRRWADWIPSLADHAMVTDPGVQVGYWNVDERGLATTADGRYTCLGSPLTCFHFSGYEPGRPWSLSGHVATAPRATASQYPALESLLAEYDRLLADHGQGDEAAPYRYGRFANGAAITRGVRRLYRTQLKEARQPRFHTEAGEPPVPDYRSGFENLRDWLADPSPRLPALTRLAASIWMSRADLQGAFPAPQSADRQAYADWLGQYGVTEGYVDAEWASVLQPRPAVVRPLVEEAGCNVFGYLSSVLGVGAMGRSLANAAEQSGLPSTTYTSTRSHSLKTVEFATRSAQERYPVNLVSMNADAFRFWVDDWGPEFAADAYTIGYWAWELEELPASMHRSFGHVDEVWTISEFTAGAFRKATDLPVHVLPISAEPAPSRPWPATIDCDPGRGYFLFTFDYLSEVERKNPAGLITAYLRAFPVDGPDLVIKSINGDQRRTEREMVRLMAARHRRIRLLEDYVSVEELQALTQHAIAYVSLHRAEGFGLGMMEAMAQATPVIATAYSGNLDFMDPSTSILIPCHQVPITESGGYYHGKGHWADPDLSAASEALRRLAEDRELARELGQRAQSHVLDGLSSERAAAFVRERLLTLHAERQARLNPPPPTRRERLRHAARAFLSVPIIGPAARDVVRLTRNGLDSATKRQVRRT